MFCALLCQFISVTLCLRGNFIFDLHMCRRASTHSHRGTIVLDDLISLSSFCRFIFPPVFPPCYPVFVIVLARFSRHWSAFGRFFKIRFERFDRSPFSIMLTYLYPTEVPTNVSFRSECSRVCWVRRNGGSRFFSTGTYSNQTWNPILHWLSLSLFLFLSLHPFLVVTITSKVRITRYHNGWYISIKTVWVG